MEQNSPGEDDGCSAGQEISCILWNQNVHYQVHKSLSLDPILSWLNPVHALTTCFFNICFIIIPHLCLTFSSDLFPWGFPSKILHAFLISLINITFYLLDLITLIIYGEEYKSQSSSLIKNILIVDSSEGVLHW
jgi:hypothetical protein